MKKNKEFFFILLASVTLIIYVNGCGKGFRYMRSPELSDWENVNPFDYGDEFIALGKIPVRRTVRESVPDTLSGHIVIMPESELTPDVPLQPSPRIPTGEEIIGYRVQIGIFDDIAEAKKFAAEAGKKVNLPVYIEFNAPFYRVRVGDFVRRREAEQFTRKLKGMGFENPLWVMTKINN